MKNPTAEDIVKLKSVCDEFLFRHAEALTQISMVEEGGSCLGVCHEKDKMYRARCPEYIPSQQKRPEQQ